MKEKHDIIFVNFLILGVILWLKSATLMWYGWEWKKFV